MPLTTGYFVVEPNQKLQYLSQKYPKIKWGSTQVWEIPVTSHYTDELEDNYKTYIKIGLLLDIIRTISVRRVLEIHPYIMDFLHEVFGKPLKFSIDIIETWWDIKRADTSMNYAYILEMTSADMLRKIEKTGNNWIDEWLDVNIKVREQDSQ